MRNPITVLFVCMGNICRSPMAEAVFRQLVAKAGLSEHFQIDSAGTGGWHAGAPPHRGTLAVLSQHGVDAGSQRARQLRRGDFAAFRYIIAMDVQNLTDMGDYHPQPRRHARLLLDFAPQQPVREVPDPYYSGAFEEVFQLVHAGCTGLLAHISAQEGLA